MSKASKFAQQAGGRPMLRVKAEGVAGTFAAQDVAEVTDDGGLHMLANYIDAASALKLAAWIKETFE